MTRNDASDGTLYLDHAATSPLRDEVWSAMARARSRGADGNPASSHASGREASRALEDARRLLAECLGAPKRDLRLTGGGTQSDNLAVLGFARAHRGERPRLLVSAIEHKAVLEAAERAAREGAGVTRIPVGSDGTLDLDALEAALADGDDAPCLVSVMWANNEIGTVQPVARAAELAREHGALFHTDAVQAFGRRPVSLEDVPADLLTVTAHKLGGPVGIGVLYVRRGVEIEPLTHGGGQEDGLWPGTQNPLAAAGFAEAARLAVEALPGAAARWRAMRDDLEDRLRSEIPDLRVHGRDAAERLPHLLSAGVPGCDQAELLVTLDLAGVAVSSGSACSSGAVTSSHVLEAIGAPGPEAYATVRYSFGPVTTADEIERAADATIRAVGRLRAAASDRPGAAATP